MEMKSKLVLLLFAISVSVLNAQESSSNDEPKTLFNGNGDVKVAAFGSAEASVTSLASESTFLTGFNAGVTLNNRWSFGGFYAFSVNEVVPKKNIPTNTYLDLRMGGGILEYRFLPNSLVHINVPVLIGGGEVQLDHRGDYDELDVDFSEKNFFVVEPGVMGELNVTKAIKFQLGVTYRALLMDGSYFNIDQDELSGINGKAGIRIQLFN